jgi:hypothetical protein
MIYIKVPLTIRFPYFQMIGGIVAFLKLKSHCLAVAFQIKLQTQKAF